jgi:hypothetical protein
MSKNGWGKGSINNLNGWGAAAINNEIGFGDSQLRSYSGETDIDGGTELANVSAPVISGTAQEGQTVTCSTGTWSGTTPITYAYKWKRNGSNIAGATSSSYTLVTADVGQSIKCEVTATNPVSTLSRDSNTITPISSTDADAQAFITAAAITNPTQQSAINQLVVDLKGYDLWRKMIAIYPFVGGDATKHSYNLKNTSIGQLTYTSGISHGALGIAGNSVGYANTGLKATTMGISQNSASAGAYLQAYTPNQVFQYGTFGNFALYKSGIYNIYPLVNNALDPNVTVSVNDGFMQSSRSRSVEVIFKHKNNAIVSLASTSTALNASEFWICNANNYGGSTNYISFMYIGIGLSTTELNNYYTVVQAFQTTLGRQK